MYSFTICTDAMARPKNSLPSLRRHSVSGHAIVVWDGKTYYLGQYGTAESVENYQSICANITLHGQAIVENLTVLSVRILAKEFLSILPNNFPKGSQEPVPIRRSIDQMVAFQGDRDANRYSPARFIELRQHWIDRGLSISTINKYHGYVLMMFQQCALRGLISPDVWSNLKIVPKLKPGRSAAKDPKRVEPVEMAHVEAVRSYVSETVWQVIQTQIFTGMRSGEVLSMTLGQIQDDVYYPQHHKNKWRGHVREVPLGPKARALIYARTEGLGSDELIFAGYTNESYGRAISRACKRAGVPHWHPHQLRHLAGTEVRDKLGLDAAQAFLGHATARTSEIYAKLKDDLRRKASEELG